MAGIKGITGKWKNAGLVALGAAVLAVPLAGAVATPVDPTQAAPAADEATALTAEQLAEGRTLFQNWSCGACHALGDANGFGQIGPALDGNAAMDHAFVVSRISNGQGAMPGFGGQMTDEEIDLVSAYIMQVKK